MMMLQLFVATPSVSAASSDAYDYSTLCSSIDSNANIASSAKDYIKYAIKTYMNNNSTLRTCLNSSDRNTLLFFFEGASSKAQTNYSGTRNNAALLMVAKQNGTLKLLSCSPYFSTMPDDPLAVGCYHDDLDAEGKGNYGPGTLKDGIYSFEYKTPSYKSTGCKAYLLSNTKSVYLTSNSYTTLTSTAVYIHGRSGDTPLLADRSRTSNEAYSIGCLTGSMNGSNYYLSTFGDYMDPQNGKGYVIVNRILFKNTLQNWFSAKSAWKNDAVNEILSYSTNTVPGTGSSGSSGSSDPSPSESLPVLKQGGSQNTALRVKTLQRMLIAKGYSCGSCGADGDFGSGTKSGVIKFQKAKGLTQDGIVGNATWTALLKACQIQKGAKGDLVKLLQQILISQGYSCGSCGADGDFGTATRNAVIQFQKAKGLSQDGIVGKDTWTRLLLAYFY
jgi:hypothetical protein